MFELRKRLRTAAGVLLDEIMRALALTILCSVVRVTIRRTRTRCDQVDLFFPKVGNLVLMAFQSKKSKQPDHE
jgi:hypothetical protein